MSSCLEPATPIVPTVIMGEDKTLTVRLTDAATQNYVDLTAATEIVAFFLNADSTYLQKKLTTSGIVLVSAVGGLFNILLTAAETELLALSPAGGFSNIEIHYTIGGKVTIVQLKSVIQVIASLFPNP